MVKHEEFVRVSSLDGNTDWSHALRSCKTVIHLAAMAHRYTGEKSDEDAEFMKHNCEATINLARQAEEAGVNDLFSLVRQVLWGLKLLLVYLIVLDSLPNPHDSYTRSKSCAEQGLVELSNELAMEVTILRAPVVYGPNAPGSIGSLTKAIKLGIPLPLGGLLIVAT